MKINIKSKMYRKEFNRLIKLRRYSLSQLKRMIKEKEIRITKTKCDTKLVIFTYKYYRKLAK